MPTIHPTRPPGQGGARVDVRRPPIPERRSRKAGQSLDYPFDPTPKVATDLADKGELSDLDVRVLNHLLRYRSRLRSSCWTTLPRLAHEVERSVRTVQRSLRRLEKAGLIRHVQVESPDPDEPRNKTGWRFVFAWMETASAPTPVSPPRRLPCHPPDDVGVTQSKAQGIPVPSGEEEIKTTTADAAGSSSFDLSGGGEEDPKIPDTAADDLADLIAKAESRFGGPMAVRVRDAVAVFGREWVGAALWGLPRLRGWGGVLDVLGRWRKEGGPTAAVRKIAKQAQWAASPDGQAKRRGMFDALEEAAAAPPAAAPVDPYADLTPEQRAAAAAELLKKVRADGRDFSWSEDAGRYLIHEIGPRLRTRVRPVLDRDLQLLKPEVVVLLDAERSAPGYECPVQRDRRERDARNEAYRLALEARAAARQAQEAAEAAAKRKRRAEMLLAGMERNYLALVEVDGRLEIRDALPTDPTPEEAPRVERAKMYREISRATYVRDLAELAVEIRETLAAGAGANTP